MSDYTSMSEHYDAIMTSGYYDYEAIAGHIARSAPASSVLEIGAGTGLILERLAFARPDLDVIGIDFTQAMLDIAAKRLSAAPQVTLHQQDVVDLSLDRTFDLAFSYGGVWYFADDGAGGLSMISHLRDDEQNRRGLERIAAHLPPGGTLLLGIQGPHTDYCRPVTARQQYAQRITPISNGFRKHYTLTEQGDLVMEQTTDYRVYPRPEAMALLEACGFGHVPPAAGAGSAMFLEFCTR